MNAPLLPPKVRPARGRPLWDASANGMLISTQEFEAIQAADCDPHFRYELIRGVFIVSPAPSDGEIDPNDELGHLLRSYRDTPQGQALDTTLFEREVDTAIGIRRVDRAIWIGFGRPINSKTDVPTIVVEFVSPGKRARLRDYQQKRDEYLEIGCKEYWIIDRFRRTMTVHFQTPVVPAERTLTEEEVYTTPLLPGFKLPLKRLLQLADRHADDETT